MMAECASKGHESGGGTRSDEVDQGQSSAAAVVYRANFGNVPMTMTEEDMEKIVTAVTDVQPRYKRLGINRNSGDYSDKQDQFYLIEFDDEAPARALKSQLNQVAPHYFMVRVSTKDPNVPYYNNRFQRGGYKKQFYNQQQGGYLYGKQNFHQQNHFYQSSNYGRGGLHNTNNCYPKSSHQNFRGPRPAYFMGPEESGFPMFNSPPPGMPPMGFQADVNGALIPSLLLMGVNQSCMGCGAMTQYNCVTCFTPFCTTFCLGKPTEPSHPFECTSLLAGNSPREAVENPNFSWMQQGPVENRRGRGSNRRKNGNCRPRTNEQRDNNGHNMDVAEVLEDNMKALTVEKQPVTPPEVTTNNNNSSPPLKALPQQQSPPHIREFVMPVCKGLQTPPPPQQDSTSEQILPNLVVRSPNMMTPPTMQILEPFRSAPPQLFNKMMQPTAQPMGPVMPAPNMMMPGAPQPMFVMVHPNQMMMAYYGDPMQQQFNEQPMYDMMQTQPAFNPLGPQVFGAPQPPTIFWPNYQQQQPF